MKRNQKGKSDKYNKLQLILNLMVDIAEYPFSLEYANSPAFKQLDYDRPIVYLIK